MKSTLTRACLLLCLAVSASSQTVGDLKSKYGAPQESYEIRPGIFMTAKYAANGQVCEAVIEKRHVKASGTIALDQTILSPTEAKDIVDDLVPVATRGERGKFAGLISIAGGGGSELDDYENVSIDYFSNYSSSKRSITSDGTVAIVISWKNRPCKSS